MTILSGIPVLNCHSIEPTLRFYQQSLQFVIVKKREINGSLNWVHLMHGETTLMLQAVDSGNPAATSQPQSLPQSQISLYFFVNNLEELHQLLKAQGSVVSKHVDTSYHMREFTSVDPEGNTLIIGEKS